MPHPNATFSSLDQVLEEDWQKWSASGLGRTLRRAWARSGAEVMTLDGRAIDFSSNDSLGLASDPRIARAMAKALETEGTGAGASRLIAGNHPEHESLEQDIATFFGAPAAITFSTGSAANAGVLPSLLGPEDAIFADALNHASLIDGCRLSRASIHIFPHRDLAALRASLGDHRAKHRRAVIVTDGLFSMEGEHAAVAEIVSLAREFDAWSYVDDAHAVGVSGPNGRGTADEAGMQGSVDITVGTLGKAFGVAGAFAYGSVTLCRHLLNHARSFVFSTAPVPAQCAAVRESIRIVSAEPQRRERLLSNVARLRDALKSRGIRVLGSERSHIVPVVIGGADATIRVASDLRKRGLLVGGVRPPTVPEGTSRLRIGVSAAHTDAHIDALIDALATAIPSS